MRIRHRWVSALLAILALLALSCASANKLIRRSERELAAGNIDGAYEHARAAVGKQPRNERAQAAFLAAATRVVADREARILSIAGADTVAAAQQLLALTDLRGEILRHGASLPADTAFIRHDTALRLGAAHILYGRAERELAQARPRRAWEDFSAATRFAPGYRDVSRRIDDALALAIARVAILPLADQAGLPGLPRALTYRTSEELSPHVGPDDLRFTRLVDPERVFRQMTVAQLDGMTRSDAVYIGRSLDADQVVTGRIYGLRTRTNTDTYRGTIYRKMVDRDSAGTRRERYIEHEFLVAVREREVSVRYDLEVMGIPGQATLATASDAGTAYARVVFTDFQPEGDCSDYSLVPPDMKREHPKRAEKIEADWTRSMGYWTVPLLLQRALKDRAHTRYTPADRKWFFGDCRERPVWLGELPDENILAAIALDGIWKPVLGMLQELDAK